MKNVLLKSSLLLLVLLNSIAIFSTNLSNVTITSTSDDGSAGTLRWAINSANSDPSITQIDFTSGLTGTLVLTSDLPQIANDLTIIGPGANNFTISGANSYSTFNVASGKTLTISGLKFTQNNNGNGTIFYASNSNIVAFNIILTGNNNVSAIGSFGDSTITIDSSVFINNSSGVLFESDYGSTPVNTSDTESDYTNRITVTNTTFTNNSGTIFSTERYVKIDHCTFTNNSGQIGNFRGVNRYQILNSVFTGNTNDTLLRFGNNWIGDGSNFGQYTLGTNNTLVEGNIFSNNNTNLFFHPGGNSLYDAKSTLVNNVFLTNTAYLLYIGNPIVNTPNYYNNFFNSVSHISANNTVIVTMTKPVYNTNGVSGSLEASDFEFSLSGGTATLGSITPTSISNVGNVYTLGINISGTVDGTEVLTVSPVSDSIFDSNSNIAYTSQANNTATLNLPDDDSDGIPNSIDNCSGTILGTVVDSYGCEDLTYPFITYYNYGTSLNLPQNFVMTSDHNLYFKDTDLNYVVSVKKLTPGGSLSNVITCTNAFDILELATDTANNLYRIQVNYNPNSKQIIKMSSDGTSSVHYSNTGPENISLLTSDAFNNLFFLSQNNGSGLREIIKVTPNGSSSVLNSHSYVAIENLITDYLGNIYYVYNDYNNQINKIIKIAVNGTASDIITTNNEYISNLKADNLGNLYYSLYNSITSSTSIKKRTSNGSVTDLYTTDLTMYFSDRAIDSLNNFFFVKNNYYSGESEFGSITPQAAVTLYGSINSSSISNDKSGAIFFDDSINNKIMSNRLFQNSCTPPTAPSASSQSVSNASTIAELVATGTDIQWYASGLGGSPISSSTTLSTGTYYCSQTINNCESWRIPVVVTVLNCPQTSSFSSIKLSTGSTTVSSLSSLSNWTISGGADQGLFSIANNNVLNFTSAANYSNSASNVYFVNVTNGCATRNFTITISPICGTWVEQGGDGSSQANPGSSAYQIKRDYPNSTDGLYWISNTNINSGTPFQIYADMTTDGGGWTLIMCNNNNSGWDGSNAILRNENNPTINGQYSIISYANYLKKSASGFQYMIEASTRGNWGGIWTANQAYSFVNTSNNQTDVTLNTSFSNWQYDDSGIEQRLPWYYYNGPGFITTSSDPGNQWWGTLIGAYFSPAPWINFSNSDPGIIWYWVR